MPGTKKQKAGSALIMALWTLLVLTIFAVNMGFHIRQRVTLLSRLNNRSQLQHMMEAGVKKAVSALRYDLKKNNLLYSSHSKYYRHNNQVLFKDIELVNGFIDVSYTHYEGEKTDTHYGAQDEEGKININTAAIDVLQRLIKNVLAVKDEEAQQLAESILEWRKYGYKKLEGFTSDEYYRNRPEPYEPKGFEFEILDELLMVRGVDVKKWLLLKPFITVYGDGRININTASLPVLMFLGLDETLARKIIDARSGLDGVDQTQDDHIFLKTYDLASEMRNFVSLENHEVQAIDLLNAADVLKTNSHYYRIESHARLGENATMSVICVYDAMDNRIVYWRVS